jgi:hypothetical protein
LTLVFKRCAATAVAAVAAAGEVAVVAVVAAEVAAVAVDGLAVTATPSATAAGKCVYASIVRHLATAFFGARRLM